MPSLTIGTQTIAVVQFIAFMLLLEPAIALVTPHAFQTAYYGTSNALSANNVGLVNSTSYNFTQRVASPLVTQGGNSSSGFSASATNAATTTLAFVYAGFGYMWSAITNFPKILYFLFVGSATYYSQLIPIAIAALASIIFLSYVAILDFYKFVSFIMKTSVEES